jgi:hypothetical protein
MGNKSVPFGIATGLIVLVAGIALAGIYCQSVPVTNGNPVPIIQLQDGQDISDVETVTPNSLKPLSSKKVAVPSTCVVDKVDGTTTLVPCYDLVQENMISNPFATFDEYAEHTKRTMIPELIRANYENSLNGEVLEKKVNDELDRLSGSYEFWEETVGGHPALFYRRNFYGMIGDIYEMHIDAGNGTVIILSSEIDNDILDAIYHSYKVSSEEVDTQPADKMAGWNLHQNEKFGISFKYPESIQFSDGSEGDKGRYGVYANYDHLGDNYFSFTVADKAQGTEEIDMLRDKDRRKNLFISDELSFQNGKFLQLDAYGAGNYYFANAYYEGEKYMYHFMMSRPKYSREMREVFEKIVSTAKLTK